MIKKSVYVVLVIIAAMLPCIFGYAQAQEKIITGKVVESATGSALPGASIIYNNRNAVITNNDGNFSIRVKANEPAVLNVSSIGFADKQVTVAVAENNITIALEENAKSLNQVIVTGVATGTSRKKLAFAADKISGDAIHKVPATNAATALQGKVAGLKVFSNTGRPGEEPIIQLRGATAILGTTNPLIIVDGVFTEGGFNDINVEDIESFEVLKGAAASSLYGSRAANGVISITTKRGKGLQENKPQVTYHVEYGRNWLPYKPIRTTAHGFEVDDNGELILDSNGKPIAKPDNIWDVPYVKHADPFDQFFKPQTFFTHNLSVAGNANGGKTNYYASYQYQNQAGLVDLLDGFQRRNFRLNLDQKISNTLTLSASNAFIRTTNDTRNVNFDDIYYADPDADFYAENFDGTPYKINPNRISTRNNPNPLYQIANSYSEGTGSRFLGNYKITFHPLSYLTFSGNYGMDWSQNDNHSLNPKGNLLSDYPDGSLRSVGDISINEGKAFSQNASADVLYSQKISDFTTRVKLQYVYESNQWDNLYTYGSNLAVSGLNITSLSQADPVTRDYGSDGGEVVAQNVATLGYLDYKGKYIFDGLVRKDGVSLFGANQRWQTYYRLSGAWRVTEDFKIPGIQELKLRASYGTAGLRPDFAAQYETYDLIAGTIGAGQHLGNKNLRPAYSKELELGIDADFLKIFTLSATYAKRKNIDQIFEVPISVAATGFPKQWQNVGEFTSNSIELSLNAKLISNKDFTWNANVTWDKLEQKIGKLNVNPFMIGGFFWIREGEKYGNIYSSAHATSLEDVKSSPEILLGQDVSDVFVINNEGYVVRKTEIGTSQEKKMFKLNPDGTTNTNVLLGNMNPDFNMNLMNSFTYKNLSFYFLTSWQQGGDIYNNTWVYMSFAGKNSANLDQTGRPYNEKKPLPYFYETRARGYYVEKTTFLKLREVSLQYSFTNKALQKARLGFVQQIDVGIIGRNLLTLTKYSGPDPETRTLDGSGAYLGTDTPKYPAGGATLSGSINITF